MNHDSSIKRTLISCRKIKRKIAQMAKRISADYQGKKLLVVGILNGSWIFVGDLLRQMSIDAEVDFMRVSSYGGGTHTTGKVDILKDLERDIVGYDVLIVEDIVDSGVTLSCLADLLRQRNPNSVQIATFLSKKARREVDVDVKYVGFDIPDEFVVGYGMDYDEKYRTLRDVCVLKESVYAK